MRRLRLFPLLLLIRRRLLLLRPDLSLNVQSLLHLGHPVPLLHLNLHLRQRLVLHLRPLPHQPRLLRIPSRLHLPLLQLHAALLQHLRHQLPPRHLFRLLLRVVLSLLPARGLVNHRVLRARVFRLLHRQHFQLAPKVHRLLLPTLLLLPVTSLILRCLLHRHGDIFEILLKLLLFLLCIHVSLVLVEALDLAQPHCLRLPSRSLRRGRRPVLLTPPLVQRADLRLPRRLLLLSSLLHAAHLIVQHVHGRCIGLPHATHIVLVTLLLLQPLLLRHLMVH
mmetsp:Transcript_15941/g.28335  ORF Transcript_15941/g.28335 Transcript_15941/m.28335 type:complete len:279 (+) Transcript_15941:221-1057(+)